MEGTQGVETAIGLASCERTSAGMTTLSDIVEKPLGVEA
jgi:hypothetical protein